MPMANISSPETFELSFENAGIVLSLVDDAIKEGWPCPAPNRTRRLATPLDLPSPVLTLAEDLVGWVARQRDARA